MKIPSLRRHHLVTAALALTVSLSLFELIPGLQMDRKWTYAATTSPRPTPFIRRTGVYQFTHEASFRFEFSNQDAVDFPWEKFRPWRQQYAYPHHALLPFYRPVVTAAVMNPTVHRTILQNIFCRPNPLLDQFHFAQTPRRIFYRLGKPEEPQRLEVDIQCP